MAVTITITNIDDTRDIHRHYKPGEHFPQRSVLERRRIHAVVEGAEALRHPYGKTMWVPTSITVDYSCKGGQWRVADPRLSGYVVKKDGTLGARHVTHSSWSWANNATDCVLPEWAAQFVKDNMMREGTNYCVGDPDPTHLSSGNWHLAADCFTRCDPDGVCTWKPGHTGQHVAGDGERIVGVL